MSLEKQPGGKIESIETLLNELLAKLIADQKKDDEDWTKERTRLDNQIRKLEDEITKLKAEIAHLQKELSETESKKAQALKNIAQYEDQKKANTAALANLELKRHQDKALYDASVRDHGAVIGAIKQVIDRLGHLKGSVSGIGKPEHVGAIEQEKRDAAFKGSMHKSFVEIIGDEADAMAFAELATEADQNALNNLIALLNRILNQVQKSLADDQAHEAESIATYTKVKANLETDNKHLDDTLLKQRANLEKYQKLINELNVTIKIKTDLLHSREKELVNTKEERLQKEARYNRDKLKREEENKVIRKLQQIVRDRLAKMSQFLKARTNQ